MPGSRFSDYIVFSQKFLYAVLPDIASARRQNFLNRFDGPSLGDDHQADIIGSPAGTLGGSPDSVPDCRDVFGYALVGI